MGATPIRRCSCPDEHPSAWRDDCSVHGPHKRFVLQLRDGLTPDEIHGVLLAMLGFVRPADIAAVQALRGTVEAVGRYLSDMLEDNTADELVAEATSALAAFREARS